MIATVPEEQRAIAEQVLRTGVPGVRESVIEQNLKAKSENRPEQPVDQVVANLREKQSAEVNGKDQIARVAAISAADDEIGNTIADAIDKVGKDGVVNVEEGQTFGMELELQIVSVETGALSPSMRLAT